ncbi:hypothetical protein [Treponema sp. OMZ 787]|uniref:hypothetical protein n=1 Tax=Treponema sp. OMZ 787 TaxID=2563669 RepID=UPI0020A4F722|nr:hypothetical protein [Treponema sp. OMZ 787]
MYKEEELMNNFLFDKILLGIGILIQVRLLIYFLSRGFKNVNEKYKNDEKKRKVNTFLGWFFFVWLILGTIGSIIIIILF